jgi:hypothetical protein
VRLDQSFEKSRNFYSFRNFSRLVAFHPAPRRIHHEPLLSQRAKNARLWPSSHRRGARRLCFSGVFGSRKEEVMTDPIHITLSTRVGLSSNAIFRLWRAAVKDDERLLDETIAAVYDQMMSLDPARTERVISLIIRRHRDAKCASAVTEAADITPNDRSSRWP